MTEITKLPTPDRTSDEADAPTQRDFWHVLFRLKRAIRSYEPRLEALDRGARHLRLSIARLSGPFDAHRRERLERVLDANRAARADILARRRRLYGALADVAGVIETRDPHELAALLGISHTHIADPDASLFTLAYMGAETASDGDSVWDSGREHILHDAAFRRVLDAITQNPVLRREATEIGRELFPGSAFDQIPLTQPPVLTAV